MSNEKNEDIWAEVAGQVIIGGLIIIGYLVNKSLYPEDQERRAEKDPRNSFFFALHKRPEE